MNNMYEILEICLHEIEHGADVDTVLFRYPEFADELRPILETSIKAMEMAAPEPPSYVVQINRAKVLQHAAQMREAKIKPTSRIWFASLRRLAVTIAVVLALFISGNGLVHAASTTIPGDNLYPVKRTWEDVRLLFTFNTQQRETLEIEHENERLEEIDELFAEGRSVKVDFAGYVTRQTASEWRVSAVSILISSQTVMPNTPVAIGDAVRIVGVTQNDKTVQAEQIELLPKGLKLPEREDTESAPENENEQHETQTPQVEEEPESGGESEAPQPKETPRPEVTATPKVESSSEKKSFEGILEAMDEKNGVWTISGRRISISSAEIKGTPVIGAKVNVEGHQNFNGAFIATKIEIKSGSGSGGETNSNNNNDVSHEEGNSNNNDNSNNNNNNSDDHGGNNNNTSGGDD